jgi:hypothetical protein
MPPLRQPELENPAQAYQGPVKTKVALGALKRQQPPGHDVSETREAQ